MSGPSKEQIGSLRWFSLLTLLGLFISDYGLDVWAKPVPNYAYWLILSVAIGIDIPTIRDLLLQFLKNTVRADDKDKK